MKDYVQAEKEIAQEKPPRGEVEPIAPICTSKKLDEVLSDPNLELKVSYKVPECEAVKYVSDKPAGGMEAFSDDLVLRLICFFIYIFI